MTPRDKLVRALGWLAVFICLSVLAGIAADFVINRTDGWWI